MFIGSMCMYVGLETLLSLLYVYMCDNMRQG